MYSEELIELCFGIESCVLTGELNVGEGVIRVNVVSAELSDEHL